VIQTQSPILEVESLRSGYGRIPVLQGVSFSVTNGEVVGMLGHNGMGKTTLLKSIMGYLPATSGTIRYNGQDITKFEPHDRGNLGIAYVPQGRGMFGNLSARENLEYAWNGANNLSLSQAIDATLQDLPRLTPLLDRSASALSGGEQQILALARALISAPDLLLLDEPTEGIQPSIIDEITVILKRLQQDRGMAIVVVEQNLEFLLALSDRLLLLEKGSVARSLDANQMHDSALVDEFTGFASGVASVNLRRNTSNPVHSELASSTGTKPRTAATITAGSYVNNLQTNTLTPDNSPSTPSPHSEVYMSIRRPTLEQMRELVSGLHMNMSDEEIITYMQLMDDSFAAYDRVDTLPDNLPQIHYPRTPGSRPAEADNPLNAWYYQCEIRGSMAGPLKGKQVVLKDNVCLAGVPMMNGASTLEGYTPDIDATIVTRMLDAGATIVGKAHCEYFCLSGGSHTNASGPVHNPYRLGYSAGGSSSGSGALVGSGEVAMAIGGDQGGSIRIPASFCGCYGMKPTHGLVPYTGIMPIEPTIDHTGPITATVADNALLLEVLAGDDGLH